MFVRNKNSPTTSYYGIYCDWINDIDNNMDLTNCEWNTDYFTLVSSFETCDCGQITSTN